MGFCRQGSVRVLGEAPFQLVAEGHKAAGWPPQARGKRSELTFWSPVYLVKTPGRMSSKCRVNAGGVNGFQFSYTQQRGAVYTPLMKKQSCRERG